jgi:uncharacterized membrane protein
MKSMHLVLTTAIGGLLALGVAAASDVRADEKKPMEKCYGIVKAGKNDCATSKTACAGTATKDGQNDAYLFLPKGTCEKIIGGSLNKG